MPILKSFTKISVCPKTLFSLIVILLKILRVDGNIYLIVQTEIFDLVEERLPRSAGLPAHRSQCSPARAPVRTEVWPQQSHHHRGQLGSLSGDLYLLMSGLRVFKGNKNFKKVETKQAFYYLIHYRITM